MAHFRRFGENKERHSRIRQPVADEVGTRHDAPMDDDSSKLTDRDLIAAYQATDGEPGNPVADALLAEI